MHRTEIHPNAVPSRALSTPALIVLLVTLLSVTVLSLTSRAAASAQSSMPVSGQGVHHFSTAIVHGMDQTDTGLIQRSSDIVTLSGDLEGHLLYHPTSVFDFAAETLVNTGTQIFSGTVLGSAPVILHDDQFRFEVDLASGAMTGTVHLGRSEDAPHHGYWYACDLDVTGTGSTEAGDATFSYTGHCTRTGRP